MSSPTMPGMTRPPAESVQYTLPSERTTISFGLLNFLPSKRSAMVVNEPSCSIRQMVRADQPAITSRPSRSNVMPLAWLDGCTSAFWPTPGVHSQMVSPMMSTHRKRLLRRSHTGPSPK